MNAPADPSRSGLRPSAPLGSPVWSVTRAGRVDLMALAPADIAFPELADCLARAARWNGRNPGQAYSVAQHCVRGADTLAARGLREAAAAFLLHDAHEAFLGDIAVPAAELIGRFAAPGVVAAAIHAAKTHLDRVIYAAAGFAGWPARMPTRIRAAVQAADRFEAARELKLLFGPDPESGWGAARAADIWLDRLDRFAGTRR